MIKFESAPVGESWPQCAARRDAAAFAGWIGSGYVSCPNFERPATDAGTIPASVEFSCYFTTLEAAQAEAASLPKLCKARAFRVSCCSPGKLDYAAVYVTASLAPSGVTGAANETGIKRVKKFLGLRDVTWFHLCLNFLSLEQINNVVK